MEKARENVQQVGNIPSNIAAVPNDRILTLPLRVGKFKAMPTDTVIEICRSCGGTIKLSDGHASFY